MDIERKELKRQTYLLIIFVVTLIFPFSSCLEEYQREIFLAPRNFNPHPYEYQISKTQDPGPVLFPQNEADEEAIVNNKYNIITVEGERTKHPVDNNPYLEVTQKIKYLINKKYSNTKQNHIDTEIFDALAEQGTKVLNYPPQELKNYGGNSLRKKNYAFAYKVIDKATGDDFSHQQIRSSKSTNGEYRVKLPDGRLQIVSYKADKDGYKADVRYEEDPDARHQQLFQAPVPTAQVYVPRTLDIERLPVGKLISRGRVKAVESYEYMDEEREQQLANPITNQDALVLEQSGHTEIPVNYVDFGIAQSPRPTYIYDVPKARNLRQRFPKVSIYETDIKQHSQNRYSSTTAAAPLYEKHIIRYTSTPIPPNVQAHIVHNGDNGLHNPNIISSTYAPPVRVPPGHKNVINTIEPSKNPNDSYRQTLEQENELPEGIYIVGKGRR